MSLLWVNFGQVCLQSIIKDSSSPSPGFLSLNTTNACASTPWPVEIELREPMQEKDGSLATIISVSNKPSFVSVLPEFKRLWPANILE